MKESMTIVNDTLLPSPITKSEYNRTDELKAFDETKTGVKGLVDSGILRVPNIFIRPENELHVKSDHEKTEFQVPIIDLQGIENDAQLREEIIQRVKDASENWGFFQVVNHGVPLSVIKTMIEGVIRFHEQDDEVKKELYSRDRKTRVKFTSNFDLYKSKAANWRDTLAIAVLNPDPLDPLEVPMVCREATMEYVKHVLDLGDTLLQLISSGLGLEANSFKQMEYAESCTLLSHYYPACPEPELTVGTASHTDPVFLTLLLQDNIGGLHVHHQGHWVDVHPIPDAFVVIIGDLLQIISNDKLISVEHKVRANHIGPRVSVACFLTPRFDVATKPCGPIKDLISNENTPIYKDILMKDYLDHFYHQGLDGKTGLDSFKL